jgi:peptide/nickel transport system substrate-binding protein
MSTHMQNIKRKLGRVSAQVRSLFSKKQTHKNLAMQQVMSVKEVKKLPNSKQLKHFPSLLSKRERTIAGVALLAIIISGIFLVRSLVGTQQTTIAAIGGEYTEGIIGSPQLINPLYSLASDVDTDLSRLIYSGLTKYSSLEGAALDLAQSYSVSEDGLEYTFTIQENAKWHDGNPVLADDVIFTISAIQNTQYRSPFATSFEGITVSQVDDKTVLFTLEEASSSFMSLLNIGILPSHLWQEITPSNAVLTQFNIKPIGSGPYKFEVLEKDERTGEIRSYTVERFANYYADGPYIESITFKFYSDLISALSALKNHNVEGLGYIPMSETLALEDESHTTIMTTGMHEYVGAFFNQEESDVLADEAVRKALSYGAYPEEIVEQVFAGYANPIKSFVLPDTYGYSENVSDVLFDQKAATVFLDEAGWAINDETGIRTKDEQTLSLTITTLETQELIDVAELLKNRWEELNIEITVETVDLTTFQSDTLVNRNYEILLSGEVYGNDLDPYVFWHSSQTDYPGLNLAMYENTDADTHIETARETTDLSKRESNLISLQEITLADYPAVFLYQPLYTYAISSSIKGAEYERISVPADRFNNVNEWYIKSSKSFE